MNIPLPKETINYIGNDKSRVMQISNLGLLFNKFFYCWTNDWQSNEEQNKIFRKDIEDKIAKIKLSKDNDYLINALNSRQKAIVDGMKTFNCHVESFNAITDSRLIIGLGGTSVIETGMTLHPLYGFPYLPGSGLKGLARAYAEIAVKPRPSGDDLHEVFGSDNKNPKEAFLDNRQGKVFFMDGLPTTFPKLDLDIMNPHYGEYYRGENPPADYLNPVPITFLAVAAEQKFSFAIYSRNKNLAEKVRAWLIGGLTELGAGGKTNVGYGYFKPFESGTNETNNVQNSSSSRHQTSLPSKTIVWDGAILTWSPGNQTLKAEKEGKKAELKSADISIVPANLHKKLFDKRKAVEANVTVEQTGNTFKVVKIS